VNRRQLSFKDWFKTLVSGAPHFVIGGAERPYLLRWYLIPRNRFCSIYLHKFLRDDDDRALHDHPWGFISLMLRGSYIEMTSRGPIRRGWLSLAFRPAEYRHRVVLWRRQGSEEMIPCWTLVITGAKKRTWGFWCPKGFVPWHEFVNPTDAGQVGKGCE